MPIQVGCPSCRTNLNLADKLAGKAIKCPKCATVVRVPPAPVQAAPASEKVEELEEVEDDAPDALEEVEEAPSRRRRQKDVGPGLSLEDDVPQGLRERAEDELSRRERLVWVGRPNGWVVVGRAIPVLLILLFFLVIFGCAGLGLLVLGLGHESDNFDFKRTVLQGGGSALIALVFIGMTIRYLWRVYLNTRASYALTDRRAVVWSVAWNGRVEVKSFAPARLALTRREDSRLSRGAGDLIFRTKTVVTVTQGRYGGRSTSITNYGFLAVDDVAGVERLLRKTLIEPYADRLKD